jgi:hypothetical protein
MTINQCISFFISLLLMCIITIANANTNSWQCTSLDADNQFWVAKHNYQKSAINRALGMCKKQSKVPGTCKISPEMCEGSQITGKFKSPLDISSKAMWQCTALDHNADIWKSNFYANRDHAALGSLIFCRSKSKVPYTCYINLLTCNNIN